MLSTVIIKPDHCDLSTNKAYDQPDRLVTTRIEQLGSHHLRDADVIALAELPLQPTIAITTAAVLDLGIANHKLAPHAKAAGFLFEKTAINPELQIRNPLGLLGLENRQHKPGDLFLVIAIV